MEFDELLTELTLTLNALHREGVCGAGQTLSQCFVLLSIPEGGIDMSTLAQKLGLDNSTMTRLVANLEKNSLVRKKKDSTDRRITTTFLTTAGEETVSILEGRIEALADKVLGNIPREKHEVVREALEVVFWSLSKEHMRLG